MTHEDDYYDEPTIGDIEALARQLALEEPKRSNLLPPRTIQEALTAAETQHLEPWISDNGKWVGFDCPICKRLGRKAAAIIELTELGVLAASCNSCDDDIDPGIMATLATIHPFAEPETNGSTPNLLEPRPADPINFGWTDELTPGEPSRGHGLLYAPPNLTRRVVLYGDGETYKTFIAEALALDIIRTEHRKVVWLDYEAVGRPELITRMLDIGATRDELEDWFGTYNPDEGMSGFAAYVHTHNPALVVFDAWIGLAHAEGFVSQKDADDAEAIWASAMTHLGAPGRTLLAIDHLNRDKTDWKRPGGSIRKRNAVDQAWCAYHAEVEPSTNPDRTHKRLPGRAIITLRRSKGRLFIYPPGHPELSAPVPSDVELVLDFDARTVRVQVKDEFTTRADKPDLFRPTGLMEKVSRYLEARTDAVGINIIQADIGGRREYVRIAIDRLIQEGYAGEQKGTRGARPIEHIRPYREAEDTTGSDRFPSGSPPVPGTSEIDRFPPCPNYEVMGTDSGTAQTAQDKPPEELDRFPPGEDD